MYHNQEIGKLGEKIAENYLTNNKYKIIDKNYRSIYGEIDLIAIYNNILIFIEVKTRTNIKYGRGIEAVNYKKRNHIIRAAKKYILINKYENKNIRFDIIEIYLYKNRYKINHFKNAF